MSLTALSVRHPQVTMVLVALLVALGASSLQETPRAEDPSFPLATFSVVAVYPGATPKDVEQLLVDPLEKSLAEIDDIKRMRSRAESGVAVTIVEFQAGSDADRKHDAVIRQVDATRPKLPAGLLKLEVKQFSTNNVAILEMALVSPTAPYRTMESLAKDLGRRLERVPGVKAAERWAYPEQEARVSLDLPRLAALGIPPTQVLGALAAGDARIPGGDVSHGDRTLSVESPGGYKTLDEIRDLALPAPAVARAGAASGASPVEPGALTVPGPSGTAVVRLRDVARVDLEDRENTYFARFNGQRALFVTVTQRDKENIFGVRDRVKAEADAFAATLPSDLKLVVGFDQSANVAHRLGGLSRDLVLAIALVLVTLLPLGLRAASIVMVAIPLSLALGLTLLRFTGFSINQLSIVGFVIALGLLVDDSIVVAENITRFRRHGHERDEAAIAATRQISVAVLGCTATLIFAFLPLLFLPGNAGDFIRSMPLAVVYTILASLLVSLTVIPFLASRLLPAAHMGENWAYRALSRTIEQVYRPLLRLAVGHPGKTLVFSLALFAGALSLVPRIGFGLFPKAGMPQFLIKVTGEDGTSLEATDRAARLVEEALSQESNVKAVMTNVGHGNPEIYYNVTPTNEARHAAELFVELRHFDPRTTPRWYDDLRARFSGIPGVRIEVKEFENGPPIDAPIAIRLIGRDLDVLRAQAARVEEVLARAAGTRDVDNPVRVQRTDLKVEIDRDKAGLLGIPAGEVDRGVRLALAGLPVATLRESGEDERPVVVTYPRHGRPSLEALDQLYLVSVTGAQIPFSQVGRLALHASPSFVQHESRERAVTVTAQVKSGYNTDRVTKAVLGELGAMTFPDEVRWVAAGEIESRQESFGGLGTAILVAAFGILAVLVIEFGTFKSTLIVASVIPLGVLGGLLALFLSGETLSFTAVVGFIALIGIEVKNSILLVDFTNQLREEGLGIDQAIAEAGETRFFPVLLTSMTAIGGLIPLVLEHSALYSPLALVIIGGLVSSTLLSRLVTPAMYRLLPPRIRAKTVTADTPANQAIAPAPGTSPAGS
jgi:multidrug efflux pump subunit AcrB